MKDLTRFGTEDQPLHPSGLGTVVKCPWRAAMEYLATGEESEGGAAADTGSAAHKAIAAFHKGKGQAASLEVMQAHRADYPSADLQEAAGLFLCYAADSRNATADVVLVEEPIQFSISPAPEDKTQAPIQVIGTLDQVRRENGQHYLHDVKTSKLDGLELLNQHVFQIAAYCVGASLKLGVKVNPGSLILPRKYRGKDPNSAPVFWHFAWKFEDIEQILAAVRHSVANIRNGNLYHVPGPYCTWCSARSPDLCLPRLQTVLKRRVA